MKLVSLSQALRLKVFQQVMIISSFTRTIYKILVRSVRNQILLIWQGMMLRITPVLSLVLQLESFLLYQ